MAKLWEAVLDDETCDYCEAMHGTVIRDDQYWEVPPGDVHPNCRCIEVLILDGVADKIDPGYSDRPGDVYRNPTGYDAVPMPLYNRRPPTPGPETSEAWIAGALLLAMVDDKEDEQERKPWLHSQAGTYSDWLIWD